MSDFDYLFRLMHKRFQELEGQVESMKRRMNNVVREGQVTKLDAAKGLAEVEANGLPSMMVPWVQRAGSRREWDPPAKGERVIMLSPTGDPGQGLILPGGYSDQFKQNHNKEGEYRSTSGEGDKNFRAESDKLHSGRLNDSRYTVTPDYAKIRKGANYLIVTEQGVFSNKPVVVGPDPDPEK